MATRGRKPAPIELKLLRGNPGKRAINAKASVLQQAEALAGDATPGMLLEEAKPYWEHAIAHAPHGLLRKLDVYLLAAWCNAAYRYEFNMRLAAKSDVIPVRGVKLAHLDPKDRPVMHNPFSTVALCSIQLEVLKRNVSQSDSRTVWSDKRLGVTACAELRYSIAKEPTI